MQGENTQVDHLLTGQNEGKPDSITEPVQSGVHDNQASKDANEQAAPAVREESKASPYVVTITPEEAELLPKLLLEVQEGPILTKGTQYMITARGYVNSKRSVPDGCVYMGKQDVDEATGEHKNDIVLPLNEPGIGMMHLIIQYDSVHSSYTVKDLGQGSGTFIKIEKPLKLNSGNVIAFGGSHMAVDLLIDGKIQLKFLEGPMSGTTR